MPLMSRFSTTSMDVNEIIILQRKKNILTNKSSWLIKLFCHFISGQNRCLSHNNTLSYDPSVTTKRGRWFLGKSLSLISPQYYKLDTNSSPYTQQQLLRLFMLIMRIYKVQTTHCSSFGCILLTMSPRVTFSLIGSQFWNLRSVTSAKQPETNLLMPI